MPAQLYWPASGETEPKRVLIPCLHLVTRARQAVEPAQCSRQPRQAGKLTEENKAVVSCELSSFHTFMWAFSS